MRNILSFFGICFIFVVAHGQDVGLPTDMRQHNLTEYNASFFNPAFSLDRNNPESVSLWLRWQWQAIDADPTTFFLNYTRKLNDRSAGGLAFFQHNTGEYFNTGGVFNYARTIVFNPLIKFSYGANLFGFKQKTADTRSPGGTPIPLPQFAPRNDFILQFAPGINLMVERFSFSLASENLFDYNFSAKESNTAASDKIFMGMASYDLPMHMTADSTAFLRPSLYLRTIPELSNQIGINMLFSTRKYWAQLGYNNFYGIGIGGGGTIIDRISLGAILEFGTSASIESKKPSFEFVASYFLGRPEERRKVFMGEDLYKEPLPPIVEAKEEDKELQDDGNDSDLAKQEAKEAKEAEKLEKKLAKVREAEEKALAREKRKDSLTLVKIAKADRKKQEDVNAEAVRESQIMADAEREREREQKQMDSLAVIEKEALVRVEKERAQARLDSINTIQKAQIEAADKTPEEVLPAVGEKYEEVVNEEGLEPGFYLIANVFGTKKYFDAFMAQLQAKGMTPKAFYRNVNKFNYVYLDRYATMQEARKARDSRFGNRYQEKTWIFRVVLN